MIHYAILVLPSVTVNEGQSSSVIMAVNLLNFIFINFILVTVIFGSLINLVEPYLPVLIIQSIRFGKHSYQGHKNVLIKWQEVPKRWYRHFYAFAAVCSPLALFLVLEGLAGQRTAPAFVVDFLDLISGEKNRPAFIDSTSGLIAMFLLTIQCLRRCYETHFVQVFSSQNKIGFAQYLVGYIHYFGAIVAVLLNMEGFVQDSVPSGFKFGNISMIQLLSAALFLYAFVQQYKTNIILANLRKDVTGKVLTEKHLLPSDGWFESVSSPHMLFEVLMYMSILGIIPNSLSWMYVTLWVVSNQTETAWLTHKWYRENFKNYPSQRYVIYPLIL